MAVILGCELGAQLGMREQAAGKAAELTGLDRGQALRLRAGKRLPVRAAAGGVELRGRKPFRVNGANRYAPAGRCRPKKYFIRYGTISLYGGLNHLARVNLWLWAKFACPWHSAAAVRLCGLQIGS